jgi:hypothetical protein
MRKPRIARIRLLNPLYVAASWPAFFSYCWLARRLHQVAGANRSRRRVFSI